MANQTSEHQLRAEIGLTLSEKNRNLPARSAIRLRAEEFISYETGVNCTRVRLTERRVITVKESTDQIDRLLRQAQTSFRIPQLLISKKQAQANRPDLLNSTEHKKAA